MKQLTISRTVLSISFALMIYYFIMELYYVYFISTNYVIFLFVLDIDMSKYIETKIIFTLIIIASLFVSKASEFIYSIFTFLIVFFLVPALITYSHQDQTPVPLYSIVALLFAVAIFSPHKIKLPVLRARPLSNGLIMLFLILALLPVIHQFGFYFNFSNLLLENVYDTRAIFDEGQSRFIGYLYPWLVKAVIPLLFVFFLIRKKNAYAILSLCMLVYLYIISGNKIVYITAFVMIFFYFAGTGFLEKTKYFMYALILGLIAFPLLDLYILESNTLKGTFVMRMLFLPSQINFCYFELFTNRPLFFAESHIFNMFFDYPYDQPIGFIVSTLCFNAPEMNANNGIISDGFMNLGYYGIAVNILMVSAIFMFFNSSNTDPRYLGIFFVMVFLFLSVPMLSMFITSGLWIIFIMAFIIMKRVPQKA